MRLDDDVAEAFEDDAANEALRRVLRAKTLATRTPTTRRRRRKTAWVARGSTLRGAQSATRLA